MAIRNIRPPSKRYREEEEEEEEEKEEEKEPQYIHDDVSSDIGSQAEEEDEDPTSEKDGEGSSSGKEAVEQKIGNVSFGALQQAENALSRKRKRESDSIPDQEEKLAALRDRLRQLRKSKGTNLSKTPRKDADTNRIESGSQMASDSEDSDSWRSEKDAPTKSRASKHAPTALSSKHQVTRKRVVVDVPKRVIRDPRFDALHQHAAVPGNNEKAYGFLRDYQKSEIAELKAAMKRTKRDEDREVLKRKIGSMENRLKAKEAKEREQDIIRRHRKEERDKVKQGKTPYYLKEKDIKQRALVEKFQGMKSKDREKLIEKRRRKEGQKEKKRMPEARRVAD